MQRCLYVCIEMRLDYYLKLSHAHIYKPREEEKVGLVEPRGVLNVYVSRDSRRSILFFLVQLF